MKNTNTRRGFTQRCFPKGFTLIELLVVVLIIGLLAAVALPQYQKSVEKSRIVAAISLMRSIYLAQQSFYLENGTYADKFDRLNIQTNGGKLNQTKDKIDYGIYTIRLCSPALCNGGSVKLETQQSPWVAVEFYYQVAAPLKHKYCRAKPDDLEANKLCMSISGKRDYVKLYSWTWHAYEMD